MPTRPGPFPAWLRRQLDRRGWTQQEFADRAGLAQGTVARYLGGRVEPTLDTMQRIADALFVSIDDVLEGAGVPLERTRRDPDAVAALVSRLRQMAPSEERFMLLAAALDAFIAIDRQRAARWRDRADAADD